MCYLNRKLDTEILRLRKGMEIMLINNVNYAAKGTYRL